MTGSKSVMRVAVFRSTASHFSPQTKVRREETHAVSTSQRGPVEEAALWKLHEAVHTGPVSLRIFTIRLTQETEA